MTRYRYRYARHILIASVALAACTLAGCASDVAECAIDSDCAPGVCTRNGECALASEVRPITVEWTIRGEPATTQTCSRSPDLYVDFLGKTAGDLWSIDPVPCAAGRYSVDKLSRRFDRVEVGDIDEQWYELDGIGADNTVLLNLMPL